MIRRRKPIAAIRSALGALLHKVFRWQYVLPRAAVLTAAMLAVRFGLDPLLHCAMIAGGEAALGARIEIAEVHTSLRGGELRITGLAAANPYKPMRNLLESEQMQLVVDSAQLLRGRVIVHNGSIDGLKFDSQRTASGALERPLEDQAGPSALDPIIAAAQDRALAWLDDLSGRVEQDLMASLATPKVVEELEDRWPKQYEALKARAESLRAKSKQIEASFHEVKKNPLRHLPQLEQLQQDLARTQADLKATLAEIQSLPDQAKADRKAIDAARKQDEQFFREHLKLAKVDGGELNRYLLGETASGYLEQFDYWTEQARKLMPKKTVEPPPRTRGVNVLFVARQRPKVLIERVALAGDARLGGELIKFTGELTDASSDPELHDKPLRLAVKGSGEFKGELIVELDRRGDVPHDSLSIDVPKLLLGDRTLGKADKLAVKVTPGEASLMADVKLDGDKLSGVIEVRQSSRLAAETSLLRDERLAALLQESLSGVDQLDATIRLAGTLERPEIEIDSNVGPQLAAGIDGAVRKYLADRQERLAAKVQGKVDEQLARLEVQRQQAQQELLSKLGENQQLMTQLSSLMGVGKPTLEAMSLPEAGRSFSLDKFKR